MPCWNCFNSLVVESVRRGKYKLLKGKKNFLPNNITFVLPRRKRLNGWPVMDYNKKKAVYINKRK